MRLDFAHKCPNRHQWDVIKVGTLPLAGGDEEKQTNEIKTTIPLLEVIDIQGKTITADALLTQRELARYRVEARGAHDHFTVKGNQKQRLEETAFYFNHPRPPTRLHDPRQPRARSHRNPKHLGHHRSQ